MEKQIKSMVFYQDWYKAIQPLSIEQRCNVYEAIFEYAFEHISPEDPLIAAITHVMRLTIDKNQQNYETRCITNQINGSKGGRPKKSPIGDNSNKTEENRTVTEKNRTVFPKTERNRTEPTETHKNPINDILYISSSNEEHSIDANASTSTCVDAEVGLKGQKGEIDWDKFKDYFNSVLEQHDSKISKIAKLTQERKTYVNARLKEYGKEAIVKVVESAASSPFLNGAGDRAFVASFDWLFRPRNFPKVLEGNYNRPNDSNSTPHGTTPNSGFNAPNYEQRQTEFARHIADKLSSPCPEQPDITRNY